MNPPIYSNAVGVGIGVAIGIGIRNHDRPTDSNAVNLRKDSHGFHGSHEFKPTGLENFCEIRGIRGLRLFQSIGFALQSTALIPIPIPQATAM
jgi:hypothetical protein